jgi:hypothetical protein
MAVQHPSPEYWPSCSLKNGDSSTLPHRCSIRRLAKPPGHNSLGMFFDETTKTKLLSHPWVSISKKKRGRVQLQSRCSAKSPWISPISSAIISRPCMTTGRVQQKNIFFACLARGVEYRPGDDHLSRYGNFKVLIPTSPRYWQCMRNVCEAHCDECLTCLIRTQAYFPG